MNVGSNRTRDHVSANREPIRTAVHNVASAVAGHAARCSTHSKHDVGLGDFDRGRKQTHPRLHNTSRYKVLLDQPPLGRNCNVKLCPLPQSDPELELGVGVDLAPSFFSRHGPILHRYATIHNRTRQMTYKQSDRNRPPIP